MKNNLLTKLAIGFLFLGIVGTAHATPSFINGSFENFTGDVTSPYTNLYDNVTIEGWNNTSGRIDIFSADGYNATNGDSALRLHPTIDQVKQTVSGFEIGSYYTLSFDMAAEGVWHDDTNYWSNMGDDGQGVTVLMNSNTLGSVAGLSFDQTVVFGNNPFSYSSYSMEFIAGSTEIEFQLNLLNINDDGGVVLDNLTLSGGTSPVPEPATMLLFGTGLVGVGLRRRKNKK
jgi:hypothetical protein